MINRISLLVFLFAILLTCHAQEKYNAYCELVGPGNNYNIRGHVAVLFSNADINEAYIVIDTNGKERKFKSMIEAVAHFEKQGWYLINSYAVTETQGVSRLTIYHYLLKKEITNDEQIKEGLVLKEE